MGACGDGVAIAFDDTAARALGAIDEGAGLLQAALLDPQTAIAQGLVGRRPTALGGIEFDHRVTEISDPRPSGQARDQVANDVAGGERIGRPDDVDLVAYDRHRTNQHRRRDPRHHAVRQREEGGIAPLDAELALCIKSDCAVHTNARWYPVVKFGASPVIGVGCSGQHFRSPIEIAQIAGEAQRAHVTTALRARREVIGDEQD